MLMLWVSGPNLGTTDAEQFVSLLPFISYSMASSSSKDHPLHHRYMAYPQFIDL